MHRAQVVVAVVGDESSMKEPYFAAYDEKAAGNLT
jgi:hypothetical protein